MKFFSCSICIIFSVLILSASNAFAGDSDSGEESVIAKKAAQACATCHGLDGIATLDTAPNLAGQKELYTIIQMKAYRSGKRKHEVMGVIAKPLSDDEIEEFAGYYAELETDKASGDECSCDP